MRAKSSGVRGIAVILAGGALAGCGNSSSAGSGTATDSGTDSSSPIVDAGGGGVDATVGVGQLSLSASKIDFGASPCGGAALAPQSITLTNKGNAALAWSASLDSLAFFSITSAAAGSIAPGQTATLTITPGAVPASASAGQSMTAAIALSTNDPSAAATFIPLSATASGATFLLTPSTADFGTVAVGTQAPNIPLTLLNVGNATANVSFGAPTDGQFGVTFTSGDGGTEATVAAGGSVPGLAASFKPTSSSPSSTSSALSFTGPVCGGASNTAAIAMTGQGTAGAASVSPGTVDFGGVNCGTTAPLSSTTIFNNGNSPLNWSAALALGAASPYSVTPPTGKVLPGGQTQVLITPKAIPQTSAVTPNLYGDTLTITTDVPGDAAHVVALKETAQGAILAVTTAPTFPAIVYPATASSESSSLVVTNTGNVAAPLTLTTTAAQFTATSGTAPGGGGTYSSSVVFTPSGLGRVSDSVSIATTAPLCSPLPSAVPVSGAYKFVASKIAFAGHGHRKAGVPDQQSGCAIVTAAGNIACWGDNSFGQLGRGLAGGSKLLPAVVPNLSGVTAIAAGSDFNCAVAGGTVQCWGNNLGKNGSKNVGKLGTAAVAQAAAPTAVPGVTNAVDVSIGRERACALQSTGSIMCWGASGRGFNGTGGTGNAPAQVVGLTGPASALSVSAGGGCAIVGPPTGDGGIEDGGGDASEDATVAADGAAADAGPTGNPIECWGSGNNSLLANGSATTNSASASGISNALAVSGFGGTGNSGVRCAILSDSSVTCWGITQKGATAQTLSKGSQTPTTITGLLAQQISLGYAGGCVVGLDGSVTCWGHNDFGQTGSGTTIDSASLSAVPGITNAVQVAHGGAGTCALLSDGSISCWGDNGISQSLTPVPLPGF